MPLYLKERYNAYFGLWQRLVWGYSSLLKALRNNRLAGIFERSFAILYTAAGPQFAKFEAENSPVPRLVGLANGVVLELGPGSGIQFPYFDRTAASRIYGIEPNEFLFNQLRDETIGKHGLNDIYTPIHGEMEDTKLLESFGIGPESVDTVVCTQVLCSVADANKAAKQIHRVLKTGGQLLFWEHTVNRDLVTRLVQGLWTIFWAPVFGGCRLNNDIQTAIDTAGGWTIAEVSLPDEEPWNPMPRFSGRFIKQ